MIKSTNDYSIFKKSPSNRDVEDAHVRNLMASISIKDMLHLRPILINPRMEVLDGQHRLEAARRLNAKIYYQVEQNSEDADIILLNANQKNWSLESYFNYYIKQGHQEYRKLQEVLKENNMLFKDWMSLSRNSRGNGGKDTKSFKNGNYKFPKETEINKIVDINNKITQLLKFIRERKSDIPTVISSTYMKRALSMFLSRPDVNYDELVAKIEQKIEIIGPRSGAASYYQMYIQIYNHRRRDPLQYEESEQKITPSLF